MLGWSAAARNTRDGLAYAIANERPVRHELAALGFAVALAPVLADDPRHAIVLIGSVVLVLTVELLNVAIETICDRITTERDPAIKIAKDVGSAAVACSILPAAALWIEAVWSGLLR